MIRRWLPFAAGAGIVIWVTALVMLALTAEGPQRFGDAYLAILLINVAGVVALLTMRSVILRAPAPRPHAAPTAR